MITKIINRLDEIVKWTILDRPRHKQARIILKASLLTAGVMGYYFLISYIVEFKVGMWVQAILTLCFSFIPWAISKRVNLDVLGNVFIALGCMGIFLMSLFNGGLESPVLPWISLVPIVALLFVSRTWVWIWFVISISLMLIMIYLNNTGLILPPQYNMEYRSFLFSNCLLGLVITILYLNMIFESSLTQANQQLVINNVEIENKNNLLQTQALQITKQRDEIILEKQKSDELLLNILPGEVAEELKKYGSCEARQYDSVSILFTDFVNFTQLSERLDPKSLIAELHHYFQAFDAIMEKHGLEKIKTIGDAYMAVSGLPKWNKDHAIQAVKAAMDVRDFLTQSLKTNRLRNLAGLTPKAFQARIGIHSGQVIAGVVGSKKFVYDIWGDAVNTAARIEQNGIPQQICISGQTYELIKDQFECEHRGKVKAKNKGELDMYFILRPRLNAKPTVPSLTLRHNPLHQGTTYRV